MRHAIWILGLAICFTVLLSLPPRSGHALGTGANEWDTQTFGWPVEIWSRTKHTYRTTEISPEGRKDQEIRYPTHYSVRWTQVSMLFGGAVIVSCPLVLLIRQARARSANKALHATAAAPGS
jgi:hypothetical protein